MANKLALLLICLALTTLAVIGDAWLSFILGLIFLPFFGLLPLILATLAANLTGNLFWLVISLSLIVLYIKFDWKLTSWRR